MRIRLVLLLIVSIAACVGLVYWAQHLQLAATRREAWEVRQADDQLLARLDQIIAADGRELTLAELPAYLKGHIGVTVEFDEPHITEAGVDASQVSIVLPEGQVTARAILAHALNQCELWYDAREGRILIITPEQLERVDAMHLAIYPAPQPGLTASTSEDEWRDLITTTVEPQMWDDVGGPGHIEAVPGGLAIVQTREVHEEIGLLFTQLGQMENPPRSWDAVPLYPSSPTAAEQHIETALNQRVSIDVREEPLNYLVENLSWKHKLPIVLNQMKLDEAGVSAKTPVTLRLTDMPLRSVLRKLLDDLDLTFVVRHELVQITTPEDSESRLIYIAYPVHDLLATPDYIDFDSLIELITTTVGPQSWDEVGGPGSVTGIARGWLIVSQSSYEHAKLVDLLANLRRALAEGGPQPFPLNASTNEQQIEAALEQQIDFEYTNASLIEICTDLSNQLGINVFPNAKQLEEAGVAVSTLVTCRFPRASARVQLRRLCDPLQLDLLVYHDLLTVTTPEDAESDLATRIYDVRPLMDPDLGLTDIGSFIDLISTHVEPQSWDEVGGPASLSEFRNLIVFSQTHEVHRQIANFLQQLEQHCLSRVPPTDLPNAVRSPANAIEERLEQVLLKPVTLSLCGVPLDEALEQIATAADVPITIELRRIGDESVEERTVVSYSAENQPLGQVLDDLLAPLALLYRVGDEQILITNSTSGDAQRTTYFYRIDDLLAREQLDLDAFQDRIAAEVVPHSWDHLGGPNSLNLISDRWLAVTGRSALHRHLHAWLDRERAGPPNAIRPPPLGVAIGFFPERLPPRYVAPPTHEHPAELDEELRRRYLMGACELSTGSPPEIPLPIPAPWPADFDPFAVP